MLRTFRRTSLAAVVAAALLLVPAVPALAAPTFPTPQSIVSWLLDRLPSNRNAANSHAAARQTSPAPPSNEPAPPAPQLDLSGINPAPAQADSDALPDYDPNG